MGINHLGLALPKMGMTGFPRHDRPRMSMSIESMTERED